MVVFGLVLSVILPTIRRSSAMWSQPPSWVGSRVAEVVGAQYPENVGKVVAGVASSGDELNCRGQNQVLPENDYRPVCYQDSGIGKFDPVNQTYSAFTEEYHYEPFFWIESVSAAPKPYTINGWILGINDGEAVIVTSHTEQNQTYEMLGILNLYDDGVIEKIGEGDGVTYVIHTDAVRTVTLEPTGEAARFLPGTYKRSQKSFDIAAITTDHALVTIGTAQAKAYVLTRDIGSNIDMVALGGVDGTIASIYSQSGVVSLKMYQRQGCDYGEQPTVLQKYPCPVKDLWTGRILGQAYSLGLPAIIPELNGAKIVHVGFDVAQNLIVVAKNSAGVQSRFVLQPGSGFDYSSQWPEVLPPAENWAGDFVPDTGGDDQLDTPRRMDILALGDSYISGEGAHNYKWGAVPQYDTNSAQNKCHTSWDSYPYILGKRLAYTYDSVACSGAVMEDVTNADNDYKNQLNPSFRQQDITEKRLVEVLSQFIPGNINQDRFVQKYKPNNILLSIGGNDIHFKDILTLCVLSGKGDPCFDSQTERKALLRFVYGKHDALVATYQHILQQNPDAKLFVVGYPQVMKVDGDCGNNVHFDSSEVRFGALLISRLNDTIQRAAESVGAQYVDVEDAFGGNKLCEATGKNDAAVNGLTAGDDSLLGMLGNESYHPTAYGHILLANKIARETDDLWNYPSQATGQSGLKVTNNDSFITGAKRDSGIVRKLIFTSQALNPHIQTSRKARLYFDVKTLGINAGEAYKIVYHSKETELSSGFVSADGTIDAELTLPDSVEPGIHTVHIYTTDNTGEDVDIMQVVYLAASPADYDGDGVVNASDQCLVVPQSGHDVDRDGTDDACDGVIVAPAANAATGTGAQTTAATKQTPKNQGLASVISSGDLDNVLGIEEKAATTIAAPKATSSMMQKTNKLTTAEHNSKTGLYFMLAILSVFIAAYIFTARRRAHSSLVL